MKRIRVNLLYALFAFTIFHCVAEEFDPTKPLGSIKGSVSWQGDVPPIVNINTSSAGVGKKYPPFVRDEWFVVSADRKVANVVVYVSKGLESLSFQKLTLPPIVLHNSELRFWPHVFGMMVRQTLLMSHESPYSTNWHGIGQENREFNIGATKEGISHYKPKFDAPENGYIVKSDVYGFERCCICIFDHPFFAVTAEDGTFEIKIPPGAYEVSFWHEKDNKRKSVAPPPQTVTVTANKATEVTAIASSNDVKPKPSQ